MLPTSLSINIFCNKTILWLDNLATLASILQLPSASLFPHRVSIITACCFVKAACNIQYKLRGRFFMSGAKALFRLLFIIFLKNICELEKSILVSSVAYLAGIKGDGSLKRYDSSKKR